MTQQTFWAVFLGLIVPVAIFLAVMEQAFIERREQGSW